MDTLTETLRDWPDTTAASLYEIRQACEFVEIHNSPRRNCVALYLSDGKARWPARDVYMGNTDHARDVLTSWSRRGIRDCRRDKSQPLPISSNQ